MSNGGFLASALEAETHARRRGHARSLNAGRASLRMRLALLSVPTQMLPSALRLGGAIAARAREGLSVRACAVPKRAR